MDTLVQQLIERRSQLTKAIADFDSVINLLQPGLANGNGNGAEHRRGRFSADQIRNIRASKKGRMQLAIEYKVTPDMIGQIQRNACYTWVR